MLQLYVGVVAALAAALAVAVATVDSGLDRLWLGALAATLIAVSHLFETRVPQSGRQRESYSHDEAYIVVLGLLASPLVAVGAFTIGYAVGNLLVRREPIKGMFNTSAMAVQVALAVLALDAVRGDDVAGARTAAAAVFAAAVFFVVNRVLMAEVLSLAGVRSFRANVLDDLGGRMVVGAADTAVGVLAGLAAVPNIWTLPFALVALAVLHWALSGHAAARSERKKVADLVSSSSDGIVSVGRDGRIEAWNPACERLTGYPAADVVGKRLDAVSTLLGARRKQGSGKSLPLLDDPAGGELYDIRIRRADGRERWLAVTRAPTPDRGAVIVLRDETRRRQAEELRAHEESERLRADLVAAVSHELRTPLASLLGFTETLLAHDLDRAQMRSYLEIMRDQGQRLRRLIDALLDLRAATTELESQELVDVGELLDEQVAELRPTAPDHDVRLVLPHAPTPVLADQLRLRQVVGNLIANAAKYSPQGGPIDVFVSAEGDRVRVSVRDEGLGIPADQQPYIFERFFRVKAADRREIWGTGLGLALSREIVRAHGGTIGFESIEGVGSTFFFELPLARVDAPAVAAT